jgi:hypothetical protein
VVGERDILEFVARYAAVALFVAFYWLLLHSWDLVYSGKQKK